MPDDVPIPRQDGPDSRRDPHPTLEGPPQFHANVEATAGGATIVSWGDRPRTGRRGGPALRRLGQDGRLIPVVGGAGAAAIFASLVGDWAVTRIPTEGSATDTPVELGSGVADMAAFGAAYLVGAFGVIGCLALVFFGSPGVRHNARVAGLAVTGVLLAVLVATAGWLDTLTNRWEVYGELEGMVTGYGQGLVMAYVGTGAVGLALLLAGRFIRQPVAGPPPATEPAPSGPAGPMTAEDADWPWRRSRAVTALEPPDDDDGRPPPIDLTVTPTKPFTH